MKIYFGERYPAMKLMDWKRIIEDYTPMVREAAKQPTAKVLEMEQRTFGMAADREGEYNTDYKTELFGIRNRKSYLVIA